jgi:transcriptional regulator with XRE-family HTH domain
MNWALKQTIGDKGTTQYEVGKRAGIHESRMSRIVRGHEDATDDEKKAIARALRVPVSQIFPEVAA